MESYLLSLTNIIIHLTVFYATIYLLNFENIYCASCDCVYADVGYCSPVIGLWSITLADLIKLESFSEFTDAQGLTW